MPPIFPQIAVHLIVSAPHGFSLRRLLNVSLRSLLRSFTRVKRVSMGLRWEYNGNSCFKKKAIDKTVIKIWNKFHVRMSVSVVIYKLDLLVRYSCRRRHRTLFNTFYWLKTKVRIGLQLSISITRVHRNFQFLSTSNAILLSAWVFSKKKYSSRASWDIKYPNPICLI